MAKTARLLFLELLLFAAAAFAQEVKSVRMIGLEDGSRAWAEIIAQFERARPDIRVTYIPGPSSTDERQNMYIRSFLGGDPFEIVLMDVVWTAKFAANGWLMPLDDAYSQKELDEFIPSVLEAGRYRGHLYRVPFRGDVGMLYYRKDLVRKPPETWRELTAICRGHALPGATALSSRGCSTKGLPAISSNTSGVPGER